MGVKHVRDALGPVWAERGGRLKRSMALRIIGGTFAVVVAVVIFARYVEMDASTSSEWSTIAEWLAAAATTLAVVVALRIATNDRRDRAADAHNASEAQARLVRMSFNWLPGKSRHSVDVINYGHSAVLNVILREGNLHAGGHRFALASGVGTMLPVIPPAHHSVPPVDRTFSVIFRDSTPRGGPWAGQHLSAGAEPDVDIIIECQDANGNWWRISSKHGPEPFSMNVTMSRPLGQRLQSKVSGTVMLIKLLFKKQPSGQAQPRQNHRT